MTFTYDFLHGSNTQLRGRLAEELAAFHARKYYNLTVYRPKQLLKECQKLNLDSTIIYQFIEKHQQTMDFFSIWPRKEEYGLDRNSQLFQIFRGRVIEQYIMEEPILEAKGYIFEVKSGSSRESISQISSPQNNMIEAGLKLGLGIILPEVAYERNWKVRVRFYDEKRCLLKPESFQLHSISE